MLALRFSIRSSARLLRPSFCSNGVEQAGMDVPYVLKLK